MGEKLARALQDLDEQGYVPYIEPIDMRVAEDLKCDCGGTYLVAGRRRGDSYRVFIECQRCGRLEEI